MTEPVQDQLLKRFGGQLERGELLLFTGAGFSMSAFARDGQPVPSVGQLKEILWPLAFAGDPFDAESSLGDIFECALRVSPKRLEEVLRRCLTIDSSSLPDFYKTWYSAPWRSIYTLNIDDLEGAVQRRFELPVRIREVSALSDSLPTRDDSLLSIHLNGGLRDLPNVTFSPPQYGERLPGRDPWYADLSTQLIGSPVVFVGTSLDESPLWQHMALRGNRADLDRELRPRSYLVSPRVPRARLGLLRNLNIDHIAMDAREFSDAVLEQLTAESARGHTRLAQRRLHVTRPTPLHRVAELRLQVSAKEVSLSDYLMGREPTWADLTDGFAIEREFETALLKAPALLEPEVILVTGTAGSGKSTALMRFSLELQAQGKDVWWLDLETDVALARLRNEIRSIAPQVLSIDDVDVLGASAGPFLSELLHDIPGIKILASSRSTRAERVGLLEVAKTLDSQLVTVPPLGDVDIDALLDALDRANRLGRLKGLKPAERRRALKEHANRQLLVAMIEATSGRRFEEKVEDECRELPSGQSLLYAILALATRFKSWVLSDEVLLAAGGSAGKRLTDFDALARQHLIIERQPGEWTVRHRVIAERACAFFRRERQLGPAVEGLLFALATKVRTTTPRTARESRLLVRLLNHRFMVEELGDLAAARRVYAVVEDLLTADYHFWLQRGSLEVEVGDLNLAENYLNQARGLAPDDPLVQTEWAYMALKHAAADASTGRSGWRERGEEAIAELKDAIVHRGRADSYPYHILGSQGLRYVRRAPLTDREKETLLSDLVRTVEEGVRFHPGAEDLPPLRADLQREYLLLSVPRDQREDRTSD